MKTGRTAEGAEDAEMGDGLSGRIIGAAIEVHRHLGPGLLESAYEACLAYELIERGMKVARQVPLPVLYKGVSVECGYRIDLIVDDLIICELKSVERLMEVHQAQMLSYLKLSGLHLGLLINFNQRVLRHGIKRIALSGT
jgi:GxxExxY protein